MKELQEIIKCVEGLREDEKAVLATVVDVRGSSYRLPGAKMLIRDSGETCGTVSGGCLEADVLERARKVLQTQESHVFTYDTTAVTDSIFSLNMGCRGVIRILLEPLPVEYFALLKESFRRRKTFFTVTVIATSDAEKFPLGRNFFLNRSYAELDLITPFILKQLPADKGAGTTACRIGDAEIEIFFERIEPPLRLLIFGAGADAVPLSAIGKQLGWNISIIDHRPVFATGKRFPEADEILLLRPENLTGNLETDDNTVAVVMSHNYESDKLILPFLLGSPARYIGALGPKRRTEKLLAELRAGSKNFNRQQLGRLFAPVGLDIGATTPESIALSIVAEIQSVLAERKGGSLRDRIGSIYDRGVSWNDMRNTLAMTATAGSKI